jgi:uncharacterized lipoprotein YmbA
MNHHTIVRHLLGLAAFIGLAGCAVTDPTQYYSLGQTVANSASTARTAQSTGRAPTPRSKPSETAAVGIGIGPVIIPGYLDRTQIVTRTTVDHVHLATFHRWAEPLENGIARILGEEVAARVPTERIVMFPWRGLIGQSLKYQVVLAVVRFDGHLDGDVTLDTRWRILGKNGDELSYGRTTLTESAAGSGYDPMIAAMSRTLVILGQEIAAEIRTLQGSK